jgi:hypothetical protein
MMKTLLKLIPMIILGLLGCVSSTAKFAIERCHFYDLPSEYYTSRIFVNYDGTIMFECFSKTNSNSRLGVYCTSNDIMVAISPECSATNGIMMELIATSKSNKIRTCASIVSNGVYQMIYDQNGDGFPEDITHYWSNNVWHADVITHEIHKNCKCK